MSGTPPDGAPRETDPLFREEAVRDYLQTRTRGRLLRISPAWTSWVFWVIAATAAGAAVFLSTVRIDHWVGGPAVVVRTAGGGAEVVAFLRATDRSHLAAGQPMLLRLDGAAESRRLAVAAIAPEIVGPEGARERIGAAAELVRIPGASVMVRAPLPPAGASVVPGSSGVAEVRVGRRTLLAALLPERRP